MDTQTTTSPVQGSKPQDRTITITCTPTLQWYGTDPANIGATMAYSQSSGVPTMPNAVNTRTGDINIKHLPANANYTDNIDITLVLDTSQLRDSQGNPLTGDPVARWAHDDEGPTYPKSDGSTGHLGYCWFCEIIDADTRQYAVSPPIEIEGIKIIRQDHETLVIDDDTADGSPAFGFCMAFVLPEFDNYYITIDPIISGKGTGNQSFMLKS